MNTDTIFREYLAAWPDTFIMYPTKGQEGVRNFFNDNESSPVFDDLLAFIKKEGSEPAQFTASEWLMKYFNTVQGRTLAKKHMARHEPMFAITAFGVQPFKAIMDGFFDFFIINQEKYT
jgi:hypothetical protein